MPESDATPQQLALKTALLSLHPWYAEQVSAPGQWQLARAVTGRFSDPAVKRDFLKWGEFENQAHYAVRVELSQFLGKTESISASFAGAVFSKQPEIEYTSDEATEGDVFSTALEEWAANVDGQGSTVTELLETNSDEAIPMGFVAFYMTKPKLSAETQAALAARKEADGRVPRDVLSQLGVNQSPRLVKFAAENVTNWECDEQGRLIWAILTHHITRQTNPTELRVPVIQWILLTRAEAIVYEAPYTGAIVRAGPFTAVANPGTGAIGTMPLNEAASPLVFPVTQSAVGTPVEVDRVTHGLNRVPIAVYYGGGRRIAPMQCRSILDGAKRADLAGFNERSWATIAAYLHAVPMLQVILKNRTLTTLYRDATSAFVLNEGESVDYKSTDAGAFDTSMKRVEELDFQASRLSGSDAVGTFNGGPSAESGKAKDSRFKNTEARSLARISKDAADCHYDILELAARYMMPAPPPIDVMAFEGSVKYSNRFDLADVQELIDSYLLIGPKIKSLTWHKGQLKRIAQLVRGEVSKTEWAAIEDEIDALTEDQVMAGFAPATVTAGGTDALPRVRMLDGPAPAADPNAPATATGNAPPFGKKPTPPAPAKAVAK